LNFAETVFAAFILNEQVPVPVQTIPQPWNVELTLGAAVRVTVCPFATCAEHPPVVQLAHSTPATLPEPVPLRLSVSENVAGWNVARTLFAAVIFTVQVSPLTELQPDQPLNTVAELAGAAVSTTVAPFGWSTVQAVEVPAVDVHATPGPVTVPAPATVVLSGKAAGSNVAQTPFAYVIATTQVGAVPLHTPPDQPLNTDRAESHVAFSVTEAPFA
jgi:hypothetical protein